MNKLAEVGDKATFHLSNGNTVFGDILHIPEFGGDCWIVHSYYEGKKDSICYIQNFDVMYFRG